LAMSFGVVTFWLSFAGLAWAVIQLPKSWKPDFTLILLWSITSIYMAVTAARFMFNAGPAFAISCREAILRSPKLSSVHYNLAQILEKKGQMAEAETAYKAELDITPSHLKACFNLARLYRLTGRVEEEQAQLERGITIAPEFPLNYFYLARIHLNRGESYREAVELVEKGIAQKPEGRDLALGYFLLADLYNRMGDAARSEEYARKGRSVPVTESGQRGD